MKYKCKYCGCMTTRKEVCTNCFEKVMLIRRMLVIGNKLKEKKEKMI